MNDFEPMSPLNRNDQRSLVDPDVWMHAPAGSSTHQDGGLLSVLMHCFHSELAVFIVMRSFMDS